MGGRDPRLRGLQGTSRDGIGHKDLARAFFTPKLLLMYGSAALYATGVILLAERMGLWHTTALKETIYWSAGSGFALVAKATDATHGWNYINEILRKALRFTILIEFVVNIYALPLGYEVVLVFVALAFVGMQVVAQHDPTTEPSVRKAIDGVIGGIGVLLLLTFAYRAIFDLDGLLMRETAERLLVVPVLTIALIPFLLGVALYCRRELANLRRQLSL